MKCKVCNAELTEGQSFCSYCGAKVEAEPAVQQPAAEAATPAPAEAPAQVSAPIQQPQAEQPYQAPAQGSEPTAQKNPSDGSAVAGFVLGLCSFVVCCLGLPLGIIGLILSIKGLKSPKKKALAIVGLIFSILGLLAGIFFGIYGIAFGAAFAEEMDYYMSMIAMNL